MSSHTTSSKEGNQNDDEQPKKKPRQPSDADVNTCASQITERKIERYFGEVLHYPSFNYLKTPINGDTTKDVIQEFLAEMQKGDFPFSVTTSDEFEEVLRNVDKQLGNTNNSDLLADVLGKVILESGNIERRKEWFAAMEISCVNALKHKDPSPHSVPYVLDILSNLRVLSKTTREGKPMDLHTMWKSIWENFVKCSIQGNSQDQMLAILTNGACRADVSIITTKKPSTTQGESSGSESACTNTSKKTEDGPELTIVVKPDFAVKGWNYTRTTATEKNILVGEIKSTAFDGDFNPIIDSDFSSGSKRKGRSSSTDEPQRKKRLLSEESGQSSDNTCAMSATPGPSFISPQNSSANISHTTPSRSIQKHRLEHLKTQHFMELFGMLRDGNWDNDHVYCWRVFGLYCVLNRAYITQLIPDSSARCDASTKAKFFMKLKAKDYRNQNRHDVFSQRFKMGSFGYFNLFRLSHMEALIKILKFIVWHESKFITVT